MQGNHAVVLMNCVLKPLTIRLTSARASLDECLCRFVKV